MDRSDIDRYIEAHTAEAEALLKELGRIPAPTRQEDRRAEFVCRWLKNAGLEARIDEAKNVIAVLEPADRAAEEARAAAGPGQAGPAKKDPHAPASPMTAFLAHTDVVFPDTEPLPMTQEGSILKAPGIGDDTANLVHLMLGARWLSAHRAELRKGVLIAANACEEGLGNLDGCRAVFDRYGDRIDEFYSFDCGFGDVVCGAVGSHRCRIRVRAKGGHSYSAFGAENAIHTAARLICALYEIEPYGDAKTTFNVGTIRGGTTVNSIAETAEFLYEYRSESEEGLAFMKKKMEAVLASFRQSGHQIETELLGVRPGMGDIDRAAFEQWTDRNLERIRPYVTSVRITDRVRRGSAVPGDPYLPRKRSASTDANIPLSRGVFANTIGTVVTGNAPTRAEWADLSSIPAGLHIVLSLMETCLADS